MIPLHSSLPAPTALPEPASFPGRTGQGPGRGEPLEWRPDRDAGTRTQQRGSHTL